jgi:MFS family permease
MGCVLIVIPTLPEIIDAYRKKYNLTREDDRLNDKSSGLFASFTSFGGILGPLVGGALNDAVGYRYTNDCVSSIIFTYAICFFIFNMKSENFRMLAVHTTKVHDHLEQEIVLLEEDSQLSILRQSHEEPFN